MTKEELTKTHENYELFKAEWSFYIRSYFGGKFYRDGNYLLQHPFESQTNYNRRKETAYFYNYCQPIVDILNGHLYKKGPQRRYGSLSPNAVPPRLPSTLFDSFWWDCDFEGSSFDQFMRDAQRLASVYGRVSIIVDKPALLVETQAQAKDLDIRPYLSLITPENLLDWTYVRLPNGRPVFDSIKIFESMTRDKKGGNIKTYRMWKRDSWELWQINGVGEVTQLDGGINPLGEIPLVNFYNKKSYLKMIGLSDIKDIVDINKNIYYLCSDAKEIIENTAFPMLAVPRGMFNSEEAAIGPKNILEFEPDQPNGKPEWLEPPHSSLTEIREWVQQDANEIARVAMLGGIRNIETSVQPWSGVSIESQSQQLFAALVEKSNNAEQAELDILRLWCKWEGIEFEGDIVYPKDFSVRDLTIALQNAINAASAGVSSLLFEKERQKKIAVSVLTEIDEADRKKIFEEIDKNVSELNAGEEGKLYEYHLKAGVVTKNEVRQRLGLEPMKNGEEVIVLQDTTNTTTTTNGGE